VKNETQGFPNRQVTLLSPIVLCALITFGYTSPANAAVFTFTPTGSPLDTADTIYDIVLERGQPIRFNLSVSNISGLPLADGNFLDVYYNVFWDSSELTYQGGPVGLPPPTSLPELNYVGKVVANLTSIGGFDIVFQEGTDRINFVGNDVNPWPGDGLSDFKLSLNSAGLRRFKEDTNSIPVTALFDPKVQIVEVQRVPAPLPLLGIGVAFGYTRKLRKRINKSKTPEIMSAIG
jgi:hypothetical protein